MIVERNGLIGGMKTRLSTNSMKYQDSLRQTEII